MAHEEFRQNGFDKAVAHLIEEAGEVLSAAGKTLRFGPDSYNPYLPVEEQETNIAWLTREIDDLKLAIAHLDRETDRMTASVLAQALAAGDNPFIGSSARCSQIEELLVQPGYARRVRAERSPHGKRWYELTDAGRTLID